METTAPDNSISIFFSDTISQERKLLFYYFHVHRKNKKGFSLTVIIMIGHKTSVKAIMENLRKHK